MAINQKLSKYRLIVSLLVVVSTLALSGCDAVGLNPADWVVMNPSGDIAKQEALLINISTVLMLIIVIPVLIMTVLYAWRYRASNTKAKYTPDWHHSATLETIIWTAPLVIILLLSGLTFVATHRLDPYLPITRISADKPLPEKDNTLIIEAVSLDWKWLFLYPDLGIATVNEIAAPVDRPIKFKITSGSVMNALFIPDLAGMIYAMSGMETKLHAVINKPGVYDGFSGNYSGHGFSQMRFKFHGLDEDGFDAWVEKVRSTGESLGNESYLELAKKTTGHPVVYYGDVNTRLFHDILNHCVKAGVTCDDAYGRGSAHGSQHTEKHEEK